jgi:hypothetical protein
MLSFFEAATRAATKDEVSFHLKFSNSGVLGTRFATECWNGLIPIFDKLTISPGGREQGM